MPFPTLVGKRREDWKGNVLITPPILPSRPPSFFPLGAIEFLLAQFLIYFIMRLAHPISKLRSTLETRRIKPARMVHPRAEVIRTDPTRVQL